MKKKLLAMLLAAVMAVSLLPGTAFAADTSGDCGADVTWSYSDGALTIQGTGLMNDYDNSLKYTPWYSLCEQIDTVVIGSGVTDIGGSAFKGCGSLAYVTIPDSVTIINASAFEGCSSLTYVTIPDSVTIIEARAFYGCDSLTDVYYGGSESQWKEISIGEDNEPLLSANLHTVESEEPTENPFTDVPEGYWAYESIQYVVDNGLMNGTGDGSTFSPNVITSRGMITTILARLDGVDTSSSNPWYQVGTDWAMAKGISDGTNPGGDITREQMATMLYRYAGSPEVDETVLSSYPDSSDVSSWAVKGMAWAVENEIITGTGDGELAPGTTAIRAVAATILQRYCEKLDK